MTREVANGTRSEKYCKITASVGGYTIVYELLRRQNRDIDSDAEFLYDIILTKLCPDGAVCSSVCLSAVSSVYERAYRMFLCACNNTVTPMCAHDFFEEYHARL